MRAEGDSCSLDVLYGHLVEIRYRLITILLLKLHTFLTLAVALYLTGGLCFGSGSGLDPDSNGLADVDSGRSKLSQKKEKKKKFRV